MNIVCQTLFFRFSCFFLFRNHSLFFPCVFSSTFWLIIRLFFLFCVFFLLFFLFFFFFRLGELETSKKQKYFFFPPGEFETSKKKKFFFRQGEFETLFRETGFSCTSFQTTIVVLFQLKVLHCFLRTWHNPLPANSSTLTTHHPFALSTKTLMTKLNKKIVPKSNHGKLPSFSRQARHGTPFFLELLLQFTTLTERRNEEKNLTSATVHTTAKPGTKLDEVVRKGISSFRGFGCSDFGIKVEAVNATTKYAPATRIDFYTPTRNFTVQAKICSFFHEDRSPNRKI